MPSFQYVTRDENGKKHRGRLEAADDAELQQKLKSDGQYLIQFSEESRRSGRQLRSRDLSDFSRELGALIGAGVSLARALTIIAEDESIKPRLKNIFAQLNRSVRRGVPLSQAMEEQGVFPSLMIYMFRAAEASGNLAATASQMAKHYQKENKMAAKVKSSTLYPKIVAALLVAAVGVIMYWVMPQFTELFAGLEKLPLATRILFGLSDFVRYRWWLLILLVVGAILLFRGLKKIKNIRLAMDRAKLKLPVVGKLLRVIYTARFARTLSSLYSCGISIVNSLQIARSTIGNAYIDSQFDELIAFVRSGKPLSEGLAQVDGFAKKLSSTTRVGEESGSLEDLLENIADTLEYDSEISMDKMVSLIEPAMIILMAIIVAFVMLGVITPIYDSIATMG